VRPQRVVLEHQADVPLRSRHERPVPARVHQPVADPDTTLVGLLESRDHPHGRCLAAAARADEGEERVPIDLEGEVLDRDHAVEPFRDVLEDDTTHRSSTSNAA
jgi:hypothetical protein